MTKLPSINFKFDFKTMDGTEYSHPIWFKPYTSEDEKFLLMSLRSVKNKKVVDADLIKFVNDFIKRCIVLDSESDHENYEEYQKEMFHMLDEMSYIDKLWLFFMIRSKSFSNSLEMPEIQCDRCGKSFVYKVDIENDIKLDKNLNGVSKTINLPDGSSIDFVLRIPKFEILGLILGLKNEWEKIKKDDTGIDEKTVDSIFKHTEEILHSFIGKIIYKDNMFINEDKSEFIAWMKPFPSGIKMELLQSIMYDIPQFVINKPVACSNTIKTTDEKGLEELSKCGKEHHIEKRGILSFL